MIDRFRDDVSLLARTDELRREASANLDCSRRSELGQFMTPSPVAAFMASMLELCHRDVRLLDAGAGVGSLTAAVVAEACGRVRRPRSIAATAFEIEPLMLERLRGVLIECEQLASRDGVRFSGRIVNEDFVAVAGAWLDRGFFGAVDHARFNAVILNPPYRKIHSESQERRALRAVGIETSNLYAAFVALAIKLLDPGGEIVAITPRSFCNGPYFRAYRQLLLRETSLRRVHVFDARDVAFEEDEVLQENVIFHAVKNARRGRVVLSASAGPTSTVRRRSVKHDEVVDPDDPSCFIHLAVSADDRDTAKRVGALPCTLSDLGLEVSTGRVVDFRARDLLRDEPGPRAVPLIYPAHFDAGFVAWPRLDARKPNALVASGRTRALLVANDTYVLTKRFTSKEERRRLVAAVFEPRRIGGDFDSVAFENHVNYFHAAHRGIAGTLARGLAAYLNSSLADRYFRQFNGHTQVNAADLRRLRYPSHEQLVAIGRRIRGAFPDQPGVDGIVDGALAPPAKDSAR
jgi:adenine-specific DNA-methyltransferase